MKNGKSLIFMVFILLTVIGANSIWAKGGKDTKDKNGLRQEDYDANGWYRKADGTWIQNPNGAIFEQKPVYTKKVDIPAEAVDIPADAGISAEDVGISASVPVGGYFIAAQETSTGANRFNPEINPGAHGSAAEQANTIDDILHGRNARIVGDNNAKDGADRIVNGVRIQTKYYKSFQESVDSCFYIDSSGKYQFRYYNNNGKPMQIEVPRDQYIDAIKQMEDRIRDGSVRGVTDPAEAKNIIRRGNITYRQSVNIGKAGTIDSLIFDAKTGAVTCVFAFGLSSVVDYWAARRTGLKPDEAIKSALVTGLKVGGITFASTVLAGQLSKMGFNPLPVSGNAGNGWRTEKNIPTGPLGQQSFDKLLRGNLTYAAATVAVLLAVDTVNLFQGRISGPQLFKNLLTNSGAAVGAAAGFAAGAKAGAAAGTAIAPGVGTAVGAAAGSIAGGIAGGAIGGTIIRTAVGAFIEDDAVKMVEIIQGQFTFLANSYLVTQAEAEQAADVLKAKLYGGNLLKDMFESGNRTLFARNLLTPIFEDIASNRPFIALPDENQISVALNALFTEEVLAEYVLADEVIAEDVFTEDVLAEEY